MFNSYYKEKNADLWEKIESLKVEYSALLIENEELRLNKNTLEEKATKLQKEIDKKDMQAEKTVLEAKIKFNKDVNEVVQENAVLKKENDMLNRAFSELGFDIRDTKDIINKLVEGLTQKADIKVIK